MVPLPVPQWRDAGKPLHSRHAELTVHITSSHSPPPPADQHSLSHGRRTGGYLDDLHTLPEKGFQRTYHENSASGNTEGRGPVAHQHTNQVDTSHRPSASGPEHTDTQRSASHEDKDHGGTVTGAGSSHGTTPDSADAPKKPSGEDRKGSGPVEDKKDEDKKNTVDKKAKEKTDVKGKEDAEAAGQEKRRVKKGALGKLSHGIMHYPLLSLSVYASALTAANAVIVAAAIKNKEDRVMRAKKGKSELPVAIPAIPPPKHEADDVYQSASPGRSTVGPAW